MTPAQNIDVRIEKPVAADALPIVVDSPHSGTAYPEDFGAALPRQLLRQSEDTRVDRLWGDVPRQGATSGSVNAWYRLNDDR